MCTEYRSREEVAKQIEMLNKKYRTSVGAGTDQGKTGGVAGGEKRDQPSC